MSQIRKLIAKLSYLLRKDTWVSLSSTLDHRTILEGNNRIFKGANVLGSRIGYGTYVGVDSFLPRSSIGRFSTIGPSVKLVRGNHPARVFVSIHPAFYSTRKQAGFSYVSENKFEEFKQGDYSIEIGSDVWIGADVMILDGVKIGDGAIIGSGAVVSKDIEPYSINVGNPIKEIGLRFEKGQIERLMELRWWEKEIEWIEQNAQLFDNIEEFLKKN